MRWTASLVVFWGAAIMAATTTAPPPCLHEKPDCGLQLVEPGLWAWIPYTNVTTITAATIVTIINTVRNTTAYSTIHNVIPEELDQPTTNAAGTRIETLTYTIFYPGTPATSTATTVV